MKPIRTVAILSLLNLLNYMDRYLIAAALPLIMADLSLTNREGGLLVSAFVVGYIVFSPLFGYLGDRYHRPRLMLLGVVLWSAATLGSGLGLAFVPFLFCRMLVGVGEASFGTIAPGYIRDSLHDPVSITRALSWFASAIPIGSALGYVLAGVVTEHLHWSRVFLFGAAPGLLLAWILVRFPERRHSSVERPPFWEGLKKITSTPVLVYSIVGYVFNAFGLNGIAAFVTKYGVHIGFQPDEISKIFGVVLVIAGFLGTLAGGTLAARLSRGAADPTRALLRFVALSSACAVPFAGAAFVTREPTVFVVLCFFAELFVFAGVGPINSVIVQRSPEGLVTLTQGVTIFALNLLGALAAPVVVGAVADFSDLGVGLQATTVALFLSAVVWWRGSPASREGRG